MDVATLVTCGCQAVQVLHMLSCLHVGMACRRLIAVLSRSILEYSVISLRLFELSPYTLVECLTVSF